MFLIFFAVYFSRNVFRSSYKGSSGTERPVPTDVYQSGKGARGSESPHSEREEEEEEGRYSEYGQKVWRKVEALN